jgi:hypothetical protein
MRIIGKPDIVCIKGSKVHPWVATPWLTADRAFICATNTKGLLFIPAVDVDGDVAGPIPIEVFKSKGRIIELKERVVVLSNGATCPRPKKCAQPDFRGILERHKPDETKPILKIRLDATLLGNLVKGGGGKGLVTMEIQIEEEKTTPGRFRCSEEKAIYIEINGTDATACLMPCEIREVRS